MHTKILCFIALFVISSLASASFMATLEQTATGTQIITQTLIKNERSLCYNKKLGYEFSIPNGSTIEIGPSSVMTAFGYPLKLLQNAAFLNDAKFNLKANNMDSISIYLPTLTPKAILGNDYLKKYLIIFVLDNYPKNWAPEKIFVGRTITVGKNVYYKVEAQDDGMMQSAVGKYYFIKKGDKYYILSFLLALSRSESTPDLKKESQAFYPILQSFSFVDK